MTRYATYGVMGEVCVAVVTIKPEKRWKRDKDVT
jgi:hypothetical protein